MRIISLNIDGYKIFNPSPKIILGKEIQLLVGVNGSGKSTILEAIAILFSEVKKYCEDPKIREREFNFSIEYSFNSNEILESTSTTQSTHLSINHVFLSSSKETGLLYTMYVNEEPIKTPQEMYQYLPDNLVFYYAGACETLESLISILENEQAENFWRKRSAESIDKVINSLIKNIIYLKKEYYPLLFALNYIDREQTLPLNKKKFTINSISFVLKQPTFSTNKDYSNLYNLSGFLRQFVNGLLEHSYGVQLDIDTEEPYFSVDYHRGILETIENLPSLTEDQSFNQTRFIAFHLISLLFHIGLVKKINVSINDEKGKTYLIDDLSEGEQQLIILDAIKKVLCQNNTVVFLDEPDAYLHPQRQRELIPHLKDIFTESYTQIIATSHSPFVAQSVRYDSILLFDKEGKYVSNDQNLLDTEVITNVLFGVNDRFKQTIEEQLDSFRKYRDLILKDEKFDIAEIQELVKKLQNYGEETRVIIARELSQLKRLKNFDINGAAE